MRHVSEEELQRRLAFENPWWTSGAIDATVAAYPRRAYFEQFAGLVGRAEVRRAVVLMGPRRVGKTVLALHAIAHELEQGCPSQNIFFVSVDAPVFAGLSLQRLLDLFHQRFGHSRTSNLLVVFDEIQYLKDWEQHLKTLVDSYPSHRFVVTGSAAAVLRRKALESGAGRFTDFLLPPLTFAEFLSFTGLEAELVETTQLATNVERTTSPDMPALNRAFVDYLNYGGYPEAVMSEAIREDAGRFIRSDIVDKVLLRDLPSLYGVTDIQELNRLFSSVVFNTGAEISLDGLSKDSGVAKNTIKKYLEYLEAAFLIRRLDRLDENARTFQRARNFKVYVTNAAMRGAMFGYVSPDHSDMGSLAETAIMSQWAHHRSESELYYARWKGGEVDFVAQPGLGGKVAWLLECKWSDLPVSDWRQVAGLVSFASKNGIPSATVTTRSVSADQVIGDVHVSFRPTALHCYDIGRNLTGRLPA